MNERRLQILQQVERGEISTAQGARLLSLLEEGRLPDYRSAEDEPQPNDGAESAVNPTANNVRISPDLADPNASWQHWKWLPFGLSVLLTVVASVWIYQGWSAGRFGIGFWLAWFPFLLGVAGMAFTWRLRWLHLRIKEREAGSRPFSLTLHIPLPLGLAGWAVRTFGHFSPINDPAQRDEIASILENGIPTDDPILISVDEDDTQVEIVIA